MRNLTERKRASDADSPPRGKTPKINEANGRPNIHISHGHILQPRVFMDALSQRLRYECRLKKFSEVTS